MAGVAGPMLRRSKVQGARFLTGLLIGGLTASGLLATLVFGLGSAVGAVVPRPGRIAMLAAVLAVLGIADLANRTPHVWRQVPQALVRSLPPGRLGLVWGFDLSLLFTTQKSTSLVWATLAGVVLTEPSTSWLALAVLTAVGVATITVRSIVFSLAGPSGLGDRQRPWFAKMRAAAGIALIVLAVVVAIGAW